MTFETPVNLACAFLRQDNQPDGQADYTRSGQGPLTNEKARRVLDGLPRSRGNCGDSRGAL